MKEEMNYLININVVVIVLLLTVIVAMIGTYLEDNLAIFSLFIIFISIGTLFLLIINRVKYIKNALSIFFIFFFLYLTYNFLIYFSFIELNNGSLLFILSDDDAFYMRYQVVYEKFKLGYSFNDISEIPEYREIYAVLNLYASIAILADVFGEQTMLVQKVGVVLVSALIPSLMYSISRVYFSEKISITVAIIYGLFSFIPYLSSLLLRDVHVALMFIITFYILLNKLSFINLLILISVTFFSYALRIETGIFMIGFIFIYIFHFIDSYVNYKNIKFLRYLLFIMILIVLLLSSSELMNMFTSILTNSSERSTKSASTGSMGLLIAKLPFGLNYIFLLGFGQIQPFPPSLIFASKGVYQLTYLFAGITWYMGWGFLLYGIFRKKILEDIGLKLKLMLFLSIFYLVLVSVIEFNQRRQVPVYPILYLVMVFSFFKMTVTEKTKVWVGMGMFYVSLVLIMNYLKI